MIITVMCYPYWVNRSRPLLVGTAPKANFILAITDDLYTETRLDEYNWVKALEWSDSIGMNIVSASLSYGSFDNGLRLHITQIWIVNHQL
jgi:hypothetical protein